MTTTSPRYADLPHWQRYQPFFPESTRITAATAPGEEDWTWGEVAVHLDRYEPNPEHHPEGPKLKVILVHGAGANGRIMGPFGVTLQRLGYAAVAPDLPGYGLTRCPSHLVHEGTWTELLSDLIDAEIARDGLPVVVFGVSLGGMQSYQAACKNSAVEGLIATTLADWGEPDTRERLARHPLLARWGAPLMSWLAPLLDNLPVPIRAVSHMGSISNNKEMVSLLVSDPTAAGTWVPLRFLRSLMQSHPITPPEQFDNCPVLLIHPDQDFMTPVEISRRFFERLPGAKRLVMLEGAGHMPLEHPGIDQLEDAVLTFLDERVQALS